MGAKMAKEQRPASPSESRARSKSGKKFWPGRKSTKQENSGKLGDNTPKSNDSSKIQDYGSENAASFSPNNKQRISSQVAPRGGSTASLGSADFGIAPQPMFDEEPDVATKRSTVIIREIAPNSEVGEFLKGVPLLAQLNKSERDKLGGALELRILSPGEYVYCDGDSGDTFFIIKEGNVACSQKDPVTKKDVIVRRLSGGDYFGEQAILTNTSHHGSAVAETNLTLYCLEKSKFKTFFKKDRLDVNFLERPARVAVSAEATFNTGGRMSQIEQKHAGPLPNEDMPPETRLLVLKAIHRSLLFRNLDDTHKQKVAGVFYSQDVAPGESIIREGEEGNTFYVIEEGEFDVFQKRNGEQVKVDNHKVGGSFGDLALMYDALRNATVTAVCASKVRVLERAWFNRVIKELGQARLEQYSKLLSGVEILAPLSNRERKMIAETLEVVEFEPRQRIFAQGELAESMYVILAGEVLVTVEKNGVVEELRRCRAGESFGERALLKDHQRSTTVVAIVHTELLRLDRTAFVLLMGPLEEMLKTKDPTDQSHTEQSKWQPVNVKMEELSLVGVLGRGSYGFVQLVEDPKGNFYALKAVSKQRIVDTHQKAHIFDEKRLMTQMDHPFLVKLYATFQDRDRLYFLMEPALGGEVFPLLRKARMFPLIQARFYAAQITLIFEYMHARNFIYRDLKPENVMLDYQGYVKLTDFGFCKRVPHKTWTMCGTPEYLAPEVIASRGHGRGVDWWTLGIFIFEMLAGYTPFYVGGGEDHMKMYDRILKGRFKFPAHFTQETKSLLRGLLQPKPTERLGVVLGGAEAVKHHEFFSGLDWQALLWKKILAPMEAVRKDPRDPGNFKPTLQEKEIKPYIEDGTDWDSEF